MPTASENLQYHLRRELQERQRADNATDTPARESHLQLANEHVKRATKIKAKLDAKLKLPSSGFPLRKPIGTDASQNSSAAQIEPVSPLVKSRQS